MSDVGNKLRRPVTTCWSGPSITLLDKMTPFLHFPLPPSPSPYWAMGGRGLYQHHSEYLTGDERARDRDRVWESERQRTPRDLIYSAKLSICWEMSRIIYTSCHICVGAFRRGGGQAVWRQLVSQCWEREREREREICGPQCGGVCVGMDEGLGCQCLPPR